MDPAHQAQGTAQPDQSQAQAQAQLAYADQPYQGYGQPGWGQPSAAYDMAYHQAAYGYSSYYADPAQEQQQQQPPWQLDLQQNGQSLPPEQHAQPEAQPSRPQEEQAPGTQHLPPQPTEGSQPAPCNADSQPALPPDSPPPLPPLPDHDPDPAAQTTMPAVDLSPHLPRPTHPPQQEYDPTDALSPQPSPQLAHHQQQQQQEEDSGHSAGLTAEPPAQTPAYTYPHQQAYAASQAQAYALPHAQAYASPQLPGYGAAQTYGHAPADHLHAGAWHAQGAMGMSAPYWPHMHQASYQGPVHSEQPPQSPPAARDTAVSGTALFLPPGRHSRPRKLAIVLRGLPGSGKSHAARLIKALETQHGRGPPRIHSLDDYFVTDVERDDRAEGSQSKRRKIRTQEYVYERELEGAYLRSLLKAYSSTVQAARFELVIVDAPNLRVDDFKDFWAAGEGAGYQVYVAQPLELDPAVCAKRSTHGRTLDDVTALAPLWEDTPATFPQLNLRPLLSPAQREHAAIEEVTMEEDSEALSGSAEAPDDSTAAPTTSRWSSMEEAEPEAEAPTAPQPKRPKKAQALKSVLVASGKVRRKRLLTWKDEAPAEDGQPAQLCEVRVLSGLGPPKQATGHSFAEQAQVHRNSEQHLFRELLLGGGPPS